MPRFTPEDLINLGKTQIYLKLMIEGVTSQPFSAVTLPPIAHRTGSGQKVIEQSRERYSGNRQTIEEHIAVWSGFDPNIDVDVELAKVKTAKAEAKKARFSHEYVCARCNKSFSIPVELDRSRPIYCEECKPIVTAEREAARKKPGKQYAPAVPSTPQAPKLTEGEAVVKPIAPSAPLSALAPMRSASMVEAPKALNMIESPKVPSHIATPTVALTGEHKKRKRRRKKNGQPRELLAPEGASPPHSGAALATRAGTVPTPPAPSETISFDTNSRI